MRLAAQVPKYLLLLGMAALTACTGGKSGSGPAWTLQTTRLASLSIVPDLPSLSLRWPQFLLAEGAGRFLWGERGMFRLAMSESGENGKNGPVLEEPEGAELTRGMDRLIAAAEAPDGTLAVLDMTGRVAVQSPRQGKTWEFEAELPKQPAGLAVAKGRVYILLQGAPPEGDAVVAYGFDGVEAGRWGTMPADGILQASLRGGGIAACPDGSVYYSYINSPRILRLPHGADEDVRAIGEPSPSFVELSAWKLRDAQDQGKRASSVAPLVKLGLSASRVMALLCSEEGLLFRQVAQPANGGAAIEVWDPLAEELVGTIPVGGEVLLDARGQTLYLGARSEGEGFMLARIHYEAERSRPLGGGRPMRATLWFCLLALLAADLGLLAQRKQLDGRFQDLRARSAEAFLKSEYAAEEQALVTRTGAIPATFPGHRADRSADGPADDPAGERLELFLLASVDDCTNSIEDEVARLNEIARQDPAQGPTRIAGVHGFFVDEDRRPMADRFIRHLSPAPAFPMSVRDVRAQLPGATTPLVLVVRSSDGKILDAHKPIAGNLRKRDAFYTRWTAALGLR